MAAGRAWSYEGPAGGAAPNQARERCEGAGPAV